MLTLIQVGIDSQSVAKRFELYSFVAQVRKTHFVLRTALVRRRAATEQLCLPHWKASFPTRLRCVICAVARSACCGAGGEDLRLRQKKKYGAPEWVHRIFGGDGEI